MMAVEYKNRKGKKYYLHVGKTKTGKPKYFFSLKNEGKLIDATPKGYEIYEHPVSAQVFLRKELPQVITDLEKRIVKRELENAPSSRRYLVDIKGKDIIVYESDQNVDNLKEIFGSFANFNDSFLVDEALSISVNYSPIMKFVLNDKKKRTFIASRYCFLGSIDDWIFLGGPRPLNEIVKDYIKHVGKESFFEIF
jgi:hypothetical protein